MSILELLGDLNTEAANLQGDIIASGRQVRVTSDGKPSFHTVDGTQTYIKVNGSIALTRLQIRKQVDGKVVLSATVGVTEEEIGLINNDGEEVKLPCYTMQQFATFRQWIHLMNVQFQNPEYSTCEALMTLTDAKGFTDYVPTQFGDQTPPIRTSEIIYDKEAAGSRLTDRFPNGLALNSLTILPEDRVKPLYTEFTDKSGAERSKPAFTSFFDVAVHNIKRVIESKALDSSIKANAQKQQTANSRLSVLTGTNEDSNYSLRPTLGYITVKGVDEEFNFFPKESRNETVATVSTDFSGEEDFG